jgi:CheY-like chemotaxis protein
MTQGQKPTVLYIEDNDDNAYMLSRRLKRRGFDVCVATDGQTGVDMARELTPDLVLMDLNLPIIDGWTATEMLRADSATKDIPVIAVSSHVLPEEREKALLAGCADYATKPIDFEQLLLKIQNCLK